MPNSIDSTIGRYQVMDKDFHIPHMYSIVFYGYRWEMKKVEGGSRKTETIE